MVKCQKAFTSSSARSMARVSQVFFAKWRGFSWCVFACIRRQPSLRLAPLQAQDIFDEKDLEHIAPGELQLEGLELSLGVKGFIRKAVAKANQK